MDSTEFIRLLDVRAQVMRMPFEIIQGGVDHKWTFAIGHGPSEIFSEEDPPIRIDDQSDEIAIDGTLGLYDSGTQEITIFLKGIRGASEILKASPDDLRLIVQLHEWAHALLHMGLEEGGRISVAQDDSQWAEHVARMNTWFNALDTNLHESLAQLLTQQGLCWLKDKATIPDAQAAIDRIAGVFKQLMRRAPSAYQIDKYGNIPKSRIIGSICLLKSGGLVGPDAWETVVRW
jgi:hypothetical protein